MPARNLTFFEYPGAARGRAGDGMVHRILWRIGSPAALDFWAARLAAEGVESQRAGHTLSFADPEGLDHELVLANVADAPLIAEHPEVPSECALQGFHAVHAYAREPFSSAPLLDGALAFDRVPGEENVWEARGDARGGLYRYDQPPEQPGRQGAGTVHHVAWAARMEEHDAWRERVAAGGARPTQPIDRFYFRSIYFREPSGVLFEIATLGPGFSADEPLEHLGERLSLPPDFEHLRDGLAGVLTPLPDVAAWRRVGVTPPA